MVQHSKKRRTSWKTTILGTIGLIDPWACFTHFARLTYFAWLACSACWTPRALKDLPTAVQRMLLLLSVLQLFNETWATSKNINVPLGEHSIRYNSVLSGWRDEFMGVHISWYWEKYQIDNNISRLLYRVNNFTGMPGHLWPSTEKWIFSIGFY